MADPVDALVAALLAYAAEPAVLDAEPAPPCSSSDLLTVKEMASLLRVTVSAVYGLYERGQLPRSIGPGRNLLWDRAQTLEFLRSRASSSARRSR